MKLFGWELKRAKTQLQTENKGIVSTTYRSPYEPLFLNGKEVARNMETYFRMYRVNADLRRCIEEVQQTSCKSWYQTKIWVNNREDYKVVYNEQVEEALNFIDNFWTLKNDIVQMKMLTENVFIQKIRDLKNRVVGWKVLDTRRVSILADKEGTRIAYILRNGASMNRIPAEEIFHFIWNRDPDNCFFGMSLLETIVYDILGDEASVMMNYYYFDNDAIPSALYIMDKNLSEKEQDILMESIKWQLSGAKNKSKSIVSNGIEDIKKISDDRKDIQFVELRKYATDKVCAVMGVPRIILNYTEWINYSNADMQYTKFIENTIRPMEWFLNMVFTAMIQDISPNLEFVAIDNHINDMKEKNDLAVKNVTAGIWTRNEAREYIGFDPIVDEIMNAITVSNGTTLLDDISINQDIAIPT